MTLFMKSKVANKRWRGKKFLSATKERWREITPKRAD